MEQFDMYQMYSQQTRMNTASTTYCLLGMMGEVGELMGHLAKDIRDQRVENKEYIKKELGDILWFIASVATDYGIDMSAVAQTNLSKLSDRKKRGVLGGSGDER